MENTAGFIVALLIVTGGMVFAGIPLLKSLTLSIEGHKEFKGDSLTRRERKPAAGSGPWFGRCWRL